ncbi:MAG: NAD-binding protein [Chloroflexi bacterium]|nr:NAD-binding protein [Chloroflexota bacterium]
MNIIIVGCGRFGSGLAKALTIRNHAITVIDNDPAAFEHLGPSFKGKTITGVGFDRDVLVQAGIQRADALAATMVSDEANVVTARLAKQVFRVPQVVARVYDPRKAEIYHRFGLQTISPITLGVSRMTELISFSNFSIESSLGTGEVDIVEVEVLPILVGRTVNSLAIPGEAMVVTITRADRTFLPAPTTIFQEGDLIHLAIQATSLDRIREMLT